MKKGHFFIWILMITATGLGLFGQFLAYFADEIADTHLGVYYLTSFTVISVLIYLFNPLFVYLMIKLQKIEKSFTLLYMLGFGIIGMCVSFWSIFVCAMWWG